jgi:DNA-binding transcriptional regulator YiaG
MFDAKPRRPQFPRLSPWGRVALLGIAQRTISIKYAQKSRNRNRAKALSVNIKTIADWIKVRRIEKNLTPHHLAAKMGIATALVRSWEDGSSQPDSKQLQGLASCLGLPRAS